MFNTFYTTLPIILFTVFDEKYTLEESMKYPAFLYKPGINRKYFNQIVYFKSIGAGMIYGFVSIVTIFMFMEDDIISKSGNTGYLDQSGAILLFNIVLVANLKVLVMSSGVSLALFFSIVSGLGMYWVVYYVELTFLEDFSLADSFYEEWHNISVSFLHLVLVTFFIGG